MEKIRLIVTVGMILESGMLLADSSVMSEAYRKLWGAAEMSRLNRDIETYRKVDAAIRIDGIPVGTEVCVEQLTHDFRFGAHACKIGRLHTEELNRRYEENFARLFNQVTIAFYWRGFEPEPGKPHFRTQPGDLESAFTSGMRAKMDPHARYLASPSRSTDQFLAFAEKYGMIVHGHPLVWGSEEWMMPFWLYEKFCPEEEKAFLDLPRKDPQTMTRLYGERDWIDAYRARIKELFAAYSEEEIAVRCPVYIANLKRLTARRIADIMDYCGSRVHSWDVVNESAKDWEMVSARCCESDKPLTKSRYGILPANYALEAFREAAKHAAPSTILAINDYSVHGDQYRDQIADLVKHGARIDMVGSQFHIFKNEIFQGVVDGIAYQNLKAQPDEIRALFAKLSTNVPRVSLSEITIPSPGNTPRTLEQQAIVAANLYRAWFAQPSCCGITWWHTLDGADKSGGEENGCAGVMDAEANPKPVYHALYDLIHREWKTKTAVPVQKDGTVRFRGFRGTYRLTWKDCDGKEHSRTVHVPDLT